MRYLWKALFGRSHAEQDMAEELASHLENRAADLMARGMPREEAMRQARLEFGGIEKHKEECREARGFRPLDELAQDLRYGLRMMRRTPALTAVAIASLAIGIGANTAVFSVINALLLRSLPVEQPDRLVLLRQFSSRGQGASSYLVFSKLRSGLAGKAFADVAATTVPGASTIMAPGGEPIAVVRENVSANYFGVLGAPLSAGTNFDLAEEKPGAAPVAIISHRLWQSRFNSADDIIGRIFLVNERPTRIIGVAAAGFAGIEAEVTTDLWVNLASNEHPEQLTGRGFNFLQLFGRLRPGVIIQQAEAAARVIFDLNQEEELSSLPPERRATEQRRMSVVPGDTGISALRQMFTLPLRIMMGVVAILLLISCANIANLLLARMAARRREISTRLAMGAGAARLVRQFLTEGALLAFAGGALGVALAWWGDRALIRLLPARGIPLTLDIQPNWHVLLFTTTISLGSVILFGLAPALRVRRLDVSSGLKLAMGGDFNTTGRIRPAKMLAVAQVALSVVLIFAASLFLRTLTNLRNVDAGFHPDHVVTFRLAIPTLYTDAGKSALIQKLIETLRTQPGVAAASVSSGAFSEGGMDFDIQVVGKPPVSGGKNPMVLATGAGFLSVIGTPLVAGRDFDERDGAGAPAVVMVNETFARTHFGGLNPLGEKVLGRIMQGRPATVVGVVRDVRHWGLREKARPAVYFPSGQLARFWTPEFILRTNMPLTDVTAMVRRTAAAADGQLRLAQIQTLDKTVNDYLERERLLASLSSMFGIIALTLAAVGIYGVIAYGVTRRMSEIGLRMALGANRAQVLRMIIRDAAIIPAVGIAVGAPLAFAASRITESLLFDVKPRDVTSLGVSGGLILAMAIVAAVIPARRAMRIDPITVLRHE